MEVDDPLPPPRGAAQPGLSELRAHLSAVERDPSIQLDQAILDRCQSYLPIFLNDPNAAPQIKALVLQVTSLLPHLQQDPTPLVEAMMGIVKSMSFEDVLEIEPPVDFREGLRKENKPFNRLILALLEKATHTTSDAAIVAGQRETVQELVRLWLSTDQTDVAEKASQVILQLLQVDHSSYFSGDRDVEMEFPSSPSKGEGSGLMWRRLFGDRDIYKTIFSICSLRGSGRGTISKHTKTLAQARLMGLLPKIGKINWTAITQSQFPEIEALYGVPRGRESLLEFAAVHMVDIQDDVLMHITLIDFYADLIRTVTAEDIPLTSSTSSLTSRDSSPALDFVLSRGLHDRTATYYLDPNNPNVSPLDASFLSGRSADYLSVYAVHYPAHLLSTDPSEDTSFEKILGAIRNELDRPLSRWAGDAPQWSLHLLSCLPQVALLPSQSELHDPHPMLIWRANVLSKIPTRPANAAAMNTLLTLFYGRDPSTTQSDRALVSSTDLAAARILYALYTSNNPDFFKNLVSTAQTVALKDQAVAAITLITGIISAKWQPLPTTYPTSSTQNPFTLPTETQLAAMLLPGQSPPPLTGIEAILAPSALESVIPWLLAPAESFSHLVGGRGDAEGAAYKVAIAKVAALKAFSKGLKHLSESGKISDNIRVLAASATSILAQGPWGNQDRQIGGRIGTLEL